MSIPPVCVIFNPRAGRGRGPGRLDRLRRTLGDKAVFWPTEGPGHAEELALRAAQEGFTTLGAAGGDGTVHEVANGLLRAERPSTTLAVLPVGSANDYAHSLGLDADWWQSVDPGIARLQVDVGRVRAGECMRYFVNGFGLGFNGAVVLESRRITHLQGLPLYSLALIRALCFCYTHPIVTVEMDGEARKGPTLALSLALGRREGNFVIAPDAILDDGYFDYLYIGGLARRRAFILAPALIAGRLPSDHPDLRRGRCRRVHLSSPTPLLAHSDGEVLCRPQEGIKELEIELLPGALRVFGRFTRR
jgi:diacylglycerol kinase family enzyme